MTRRHAAARWRRLAAPCVVAASALAAQAATAGAQPSTPLVAAASTARPEPAAESGQDVSAPQGGSTFDIWVDRAQRWFDPEREGFYPWIGSIMPGGWMAVGGGYRQTLARGIRADAMAGISLRNYKLLDASLTVPVTADDSVTVDLHTRLMDAPRVHLYGVGNDTLEESLSRFDFEPKLVEARVRVRPQEGVEVGGSVGMLHVGSGPGAGGRSATDLFSPADVPGLNDTASYRTLGLFAQVDRRDARDFTRRGGWYRADWLVLADGDEEPYGHQRLDLDVRQFFPVFDERQAVLARVVFTTTNASGDDVVPHFLMPMLGDGENLRGFANQRFVDRQRLLLQGEYRYRLNERLHVAGFLDLGRVAPDVGGLSFGGFHPSGGAGIRVQTAEGLGVRVDIARSAEQWAFIVSSIVF